MWRISYYICCFIGFLLRMHLAVSDKCFIINKCLVTFSFSAIRQMLLQLSDSSYCLYCSFFSVYRPVDKSYIISWLLGYYDFSMIQFINTIHEVFSTLYHCLQYSPKTMYSLKCPYVSPIGIVLQCNLSASQTPAEVLCSFVWSVWLHRDIVVVNC